MAVVSYQSGCGMGSAHQLHLPAHWIYIRHHLQDLIRGHVVRTEPLRESFTEKDATKQRAEQAIDKGGG